MDTPFRGELVDRAQPCRPVRRVLYLCILHTTSRPTTAISAGFPDEARKLASELYPAAASQGLLTELLLCSRQRANHHAAIERQLEARLLLVGKAQRGEASELWLMGESNLRGLLRSYQISQARKKASERFRKPELAVYKAAGALISFVQRCFRDEVETAILLDEEPIVPDPLFGRELRVTQRHAFEALWRPRHGHADAKRIQLELTDNVPLALCVRCGKVFLDNCTVHGAAKVASLCRDRCAHS